jgi:cytochrome b561
MNFKYNAVTRATHWLTVILVAATFTLAPEDINEIVDPNQDLGVQTHETLGVIVFGLTIFRLFWVFLVQRQLDIPMSQWARISSKIVQGLLYLLLILVPLTAIFGTWLKGGDLSLLREIVVTSPIQTNKKVGDLFMDLHPVFADTLIWFAVLHAAAALFHHYFLRDSVLKSMLPK